MTNTDESAQTLPTPADAPQAITPDEPADLQLYVATVNVPGYSPMSDEPNVFRTAEDAWSFLADERERGLDGCESDTNDECEDAMRFLAETQVTAAAREIHNGSLTAMVDSFSLCGTIYGATPGYEGDHDLGLAYSVTADDTLVRASDVVLVGYTEAMTWANAVCDVEDCADRESGDCEHSNSAHDHFSLEDFSEDDQRSMRVDVHAMMLGADEDGSAFLAYCDARPILGGAAAEYFGHDFALTRNGHGAGYWDRGIGALGDRLTDWAKTFGESSVFVSENGVTLS